MKEKHHRYNKITIDTVFDTAIRDTETIDNRSFAKRFFKKNIKKGSIIAPAFFASIPLIASVPFVVESFRYGNHVLSKSGWMQGVTLAFLTVTSGVAVYNMMGNPKRQRERAIENINTLPSGNSRDVIVDEFVESAKEYCINIIKKKQSVTSNDKMIFKELVAQ